MIIKDKTKIGFHRVFLLDRILQLLQKNKGQAEIEKLIELAEEIKEGLTLQELMPLQFEEIESLLVSAYISLKEAVCYIDGKKEALNYVDKLLSKALSIITDYSEEGYKTDVFHMTSDGIYPASSNRFKYKSFNSEEFYNKRIEQINKEKNELISQVEGIKKKLETTSDKSERLKIDLENKEKKLNESITLIKEYQKEQLQREKINDAKVEWNTKITDAFEDLKKHIEPIRDEHSRLNKLFWAYSILSFIILAAIFAIEYMIYCKIESNVTLLTWSSYLPLIIPIPIAIGGLWGFITLMHRVQRQMVILAKYIYEIKYVEGLLITKNKLSTNIDESMSKVNSAIEKLLENLLNSNKIITEELTLEKDEKRDSMPYEDVIKLIKEVARVIK